MQENDDTPVGPAPSRLPWIAAGVALLVYTLTLNHWVTVASLPLVAKVANWDWWSLNLQAPLFYLVTYPIRWLPPGWQPALLNLLSAICAAGTVGLLVRSVMLLPHDRTREQRQRERSEFSLLTIPRAWLPPVFAALVCGCQLTFWEHATAATGEMLNLLLFAYIVRSLLEYRVEPQDSWLYRLAFVYGLATANNWAMIGFFVPVLVALIWILGLRFLRLSFILKTAGFGFLGLLLYLFLPLVEKFGNGADLSFWELLRMQWALQKGILFGFPKYIVLVCSLTSLLPVLVMGFRWPSSFGDVSVLGAVLTNFMFRVVHIVFLGVCVWVIFDPSWSPRSIGFGFAFLPLYYLSALSVGYFSGYFLLVFGTEPERRRHHVSPVTQGLNRLLVAVVWVALVAGPAGLIYRNWPQIRGNNGPHLYRLAADMADGLPGKGALVLSDDAINLLLVEAVYARRGTQNPSVLVDSRSLPYHVYQRSLHQRYPQIWPDLLAGRTLSNPIEPLPLLLALIELARTNEIFYLHPPFNYYAEGLESQPQGVVYRLRPYALNVVTNAAPTPEVLASNTAFWTKAEREFTPVPAPVRKTEKEATLSDAASAMRVYSRAVNYWGCELQRSGRLAEAGKCFELAVKFNPENLVAAVNRQYNQNLAKGQNRPVELAPAQEAKLKDKYAEAVRADGPFDEPQYCAKLGTSFASAHPMLIRQAAQQFLRVRALDPANVLAQVWLANLYLEWPLPEKTLEVVQELEARQNREPLSLEYQIELLRLKAWAFARTPAFAASDLVDAPKLAAKLKGQPDPISAYLWTNFAKATQGLLANYPAADRKSDPVTSALVFELNRVCQGGTIYDPGRFAGVTLSAETRQLLAQYRPGQPCVRLNRRLLEDAYPQELARKAGPLITNLDGAVLVLEAAEKKNPTIASLPEYLSQIYLKAGHFSNALAAVERELRLDPKNVSALFNKGSLCIQLGKFDEAIPPLSQVLQADSKNDAARVNRAWACLRSGELAALKGQEHLKKGEKAAADAQVELANKQVEAAEADYLILRDTLMAGEIYRVDYGLGQIAYHRNQKEKALENYELYLKHLPRDAQGMPAIPNEIPVSESVTNRLKELRAGGGGR